MDFKIDTKDSFSVISPVADTIDAKMTDALATKCNEIRQNGSSNIIVDLKSCQNADADALNELVALHESSYAASQSLVFTGMTTTVMNAFKENETDLLLNMAPSMAEAVDIISMEILERELLGEE